MPIPATNATTVRHALNRWTFGPTTALASQVQSMGLNAYMESQLSSWKTADAGANAATSGFTTLSQSSAQLWSSYSTGNFWIPARELQAASLLRAVRADHQLYERMVEFWSDHFNIEIVGDLQWVLKPVDDRTVIRKYALGRFEDLLLASSLSPAMLVYLDQWKSSGTKPNENYARELLELHTLGVDGGYTEDDVKAAARLLTGWSVDFNTFTFKYFSASHDPTPAKILGVTYGPSGSTSADGVSLVRALARHPSTARHIATKLCRRFVSDNPPSFLIQSVANAYLSANTDIAATLRHLFKSGTFWASIDTKVRRPIDAGVAFLRAASAQFALSSPDPVVSDGLKALFVSYFDKMGQGPFRCPRRTDFPSPRKHGLIQAGCSPAGTSSFWSLWASYTA